MAKTIQDEKTIEFLNSLSEKHGSKPIVWKSFSLWYADTTGIIRQYGVFLYQIEDVFYYEDFEREDTFLGIRMNSKKKSQYVKFEGSLNPSDIVCIRKVTKSSALAFVKGGKKEPGSANLFQRMFKDIVTMVKLKDNSAVFFHLPDKSFEKTVEKYIGE